jgi:hypothetical protein
MGSAGTAHLLCWATEITQRRFEEDGEDGMAMVLIFWIWGALGKGGGEKSLMRSYIGGSDSKVTGLQHLSLGQGEAVRALRVAYG